jgi:hypothetical protein
VTATAFQPVLATGIFHQDSAHRFGGRCKEMCARLPPCGVARRLAGRRAITAAIRFFGEQPQICLMDQRSCPQRLSGFFVSQFRRGQPPQLVIDDCQKPIGRLSIACRICVTSFT